SSVESWRESWLAPLRIHAAIATTLAFFALLVAGLGTYGVLAYLVTQRTQEIGIRLALGATSANVRWLIVRSVMAMVGGGILAGGVASFALMRLLGSMLYGSSPTDPSVFATAALTVFTTALLAACVPARRATNVSPLTAMRVE
ncbi:MAG TPA: FtsX-like permease family protein, partial [Gemmatimonadaceae bacterium]